MKITLVMSPKRMIVAATAEDQALLNQVRVGDLLPVSIIKPRNGDHHRKFWALMAFVADNHPGRPDEQTGELIEWGGAEAVADYLKIRTQHFSGVIVHGGHVYCPLRSISYRELDEAEFTAWVNKAKEIVFSELFPGLRDRERIEAEVERWTEWT